LNNTRYINSLIEDGWINADLYYKLKDHQIDLYNQITKGNNKKHVVNCSRRFGKSYTLCLIAIEHALKSKVHVRFAAPTSKQLKEIIQPIMAHDSFCHQKPGDSASIIVDSIVNDDPSKRIRRENFDWIREQSESKEEFRYVESKEDVWGLSTLSSLPIKDMSFHHERVSPKNNVIKKQKFEISDGNDNFDPNLWNFIDQI
jgi:hypothetical protein